MSGVTIEVIKAKKMRVREAMKIVFAAIEEETALHRRELDKTTTGWSSPPIMMTVSGYQGNDYVSNTAPRRGDVDKWNWTDKGTSAHTIRARNAPMLVFQAGYRARTTPRKFSSGPKRRSGPTIRKPSVRHPGTKARGWSEELTNRREQPFANRIDRAMMQAAKVMF